MPAYWTELTDHDSHMDSFQPGLLGVKTLRPQSDSSQYWWNSGWNHCYWNDLLFIPTGPGASKGTPDDAKCKMRHRNPWGTKNKEVWGRNLPFCFKGK